MIKFFRKIRQKMLSENKFSKYLIYAIGEIVLVVIGILIALSINNLNEGNKINSLKLNYYVQLSEDLEKDKKHIKSLLDFFNTNINIYNTYIESFKNPNLDFEQIINNASKLEFTTRQIGFQSSTLQSLIYTSDIKLFPSVLQNKLIEMKNRQDQLIAISNYNDEEFLDRLRPAAQLGWGSSASRLFSSPLLKNKKYDEEHWTKIILSIESATEIKVFSETSSINSLKKILDDIEVINEIMNDKSKKKRKHNNEYN